MAVAAAWLAVAARAQVAVLHRVVVRRVFPWVAVVPGQEVRDGVAPAAVAD